MLIVIHTGLPTYATKFIEMVLMLIADHRPAVSGAMNTPVASRAGKDLISPLASGLLTIGFGFGGAFKIININDRLDVIIRPCRTQL